jgi:hypothetical protein
MDSYVTANARCVVDHLELDAECSIDMRPDGADEGTPDITDAEITVATREAIVGVIGKLQAVVNGRFAKVAIKFEESAAGKARSAAVGERAAARPLAACETTEGNPSQLWASRIHSTYQRLFGEMRVSIPEHLRIEAIETRLRKLVDGRASLERQLKGEPGWKIRGQFLALETALHASEHGLDTRVYGILAAR